MDELDRMKTKIDEDGIMIFIDTNTRKTKKNRHRHIKDSAPKKERGKAGSNGSFYENDILYKKMYAEEEECSQD